MNKKDSKSSHIVCIGGGTGTYSLLTGLRQVCNNITVIVSMADTGGSARKELDEFGLLPSSDIRKSLVGLADTQSEEDNLLRELFQYRYNQGTGVKGMTFGNLFLVALTKLLGSQLKAIEKAGQILRIKGRVLPVSLDRVDLVAEYENGLIIKGEHLIDEPKHDSDLQIIKLSTTPTAKVYPPVLDAIKGANMIILGPGGLYTTLIANLVIDGVCKAIAKSSAKKVHIMNLMTEHGQTHKLSASGHIKVIEKHLGENVIDYVLINAGRIPKDILEKYQTAHGQPVCNDLTNNEQFQVINTNLLFPKEVKRVSGDMLKRSLIRHDPKKLAKEIIKLL